jgi:iron complex outermembrane receptor protein
MCGKRSLICLSLLAAAGNALAAVETDLTQLSIEELMAIEITSVAKKSQRLSDAAAAIHVITADDIRRSGATSLPELLRQVPGVQVARIDGSRYAVSIRGFSNRFSGKLLVLQDGRTLYSPLFAGVYWEAQDVLLEDVERIEVIRGPGGTLWGANAVNGVINIITRPAKDSQGGYLEARGGSLENGAAARYGGQIGDTGHFRVYAKFDDHDELDSAAGQAAHDAWKQRRAGFRADIAVDARDAVTLQGDLYEGRADQLEGVSSLFPAGTTFRPDTADLNGGNLQFRWRRSIDAAEDWQVQAFIDRAELHDAVLDQRIDTVDLEWQHRFRPSPAQELTWGLGYRHIADELRGGFTISFAQEKRDSDLYSAFVQDEIRLAEDLRLTLGSKFEHNDYTGFEVQPSLRLLWQATATDTFWGALSRAVQTPSRATQDSRLNYLVLPGAPFPTVLGYRGSPDFQSEELLAGEIGYRGQYGPNFNLDATAFYNDYDKLLSRESNPVVPPPPYLLATNLYGNLMEGRTYGIELSANWQVTPSWRLRASYSRLEMDLDLKAGSSDTTGPTGPAGSAGNSPKHMAQVHSLHDLGHKLELDAFLYYVDELPSQGIGDYTRLDLRLGWRPVRDLELSLTARNLLDNRHPEYQAQDVTASQVPCSLLGQIRWRF